MSQHIYILTIVALATFLVNLPFGALRAREKKYSLKWFLYIHLPIPIIVLMRHYSDIGFALYTYPILVGAFFAGQMTGRKVFATLPLRKQN